jgi:hypothetical protein
VLNREFNGIVICGLTLQDLRLRVFGGRLRVMFGSKWKGTGENCIKASFQIYRASGGRDVKLTTHLQLEPRPRIRGSIQPLHLTSSWCTGITLLLIFTKYFQNNQITDDVIDRTYTKISHTCTSFESVLGVDGRTELKLTLMGGRIHLFWIPHWIIGFFEMKEVFSGLAAFSSSRRIMELRGYFHTFVRLNLHKRNPNFLSGKF